MKQAPEGVGDIHVQGTECLPYISGLKNVVLVPLSVQPHNVFSRSCNVMVLNRKICDRIY